MSFLAEVLSTAEKVGLDQINKKVPELAANVGNIKANVVSYIENVYVKYSDRPKENRLLLKNALEVERELTNLMKSAEYVSKKELVKASDEVKRNVEKLDAINLALKFVLDCQKSNQLIIEFSNELEEKNYMKCGEIIKELEERIGSIPDDEYLEIFGEFKASITQNWSILQNELEKIFTHNIKFKENTKNITGYELKIKENNKEMEQALQAMYYTTEIVQPLHVIAKHLWENIFTLIVDFETNLKIYKESEYMIMEIEKKSNEKCKNYKTVFRNLEIVLKFLTENFNYGIKDDLTTNRYIGNDIRDNLSELIIKHCLQDTIPSNEEQLKTYDVVKQDIIQLEQTFRDSKIFEESSTSLYDFASNIDTHFINKKCQDYLITADAIMRKDLHDTIEVGTPYDPKNPLNANLDKFLQCSVSKSAIKILDLCESILVKSQSVSDQCAGKLFCTVQNIFIKYAEAVPEYHKKLLRAIPQQVALFHNNCVYMAYNLTVWNEKYCAKRTEMLPLWSFQNDILKLRIVASEKFTEYVQGQVNQIQTIMKEAALDGITIEKLDQITEKSFRQCLRQQELLKTVWHKVLSYTVYNRTLGIIFNTFCSIIINSIVKYEDISAEAAEQLVEVNKIALTRGPKLFTDPNEISIYVSSWHKLNELNFVLSAGLVGINDRWADGKGPLALHFTPKELKQLIRALFQNTDRRAAVLAKINE